MSDHPEDARLLELAEGGAPSGDAHVAGCAECRERIEAYVGTAGLLQSASPLSRAYCPSRDELIAREAELTPGRVVARHRHMAACPLCREDLRDFRVLEAEPAPTLAEAAASVAEVVKAKVVLGLDLAARTLKLLESTLAPQPVPALAPVRGAGGSTGVVLRVPFGEGELEISWVAARGGVDLQTRALGGAPRTYRIALLPEEGSSGVWESRTADEAGVAGISGIEPGSHGLAAYGPQSRDPDVEISLSLNSV